MITNTNLNPRANLPSQKTEQKNPTTTQAPSGKTKSLSFEEYQKSLNSYKVSTSANDNTGLKSIITQMLMSPEGLKNIQNLLINSNHLLNLKSNNNASALHIAAENNDFHSVKNLLEEGAKLEPDSKGNTPAHTAAKTGKIKILNLFIQQDKTCLTQKNNSGNTPFLTAAAHNQVKALDLIIQNLPSKTDLFAENNENLQAPHVAAKEGCISALEFFLNQKDFNIDHKNSTGDTFLKIACEYYNLKTTKFLIEKGANVNLKNDSSEAPLFSLIKEEPFSAFEKKGKKAYAYMIEAREEIIRLLLSTKGINVNTQNSNGHTPIYSIIREPIQLALIKLLLEKGANPNFLYENNNTLLHIAIEEMHLQKSYKKDYSRIIEILLDTKNINLNIQGLKGNTPLNLACYRKFFEIAKKLLVKGANPNISNDCKVNPLSEVICYSTLENIKFFLEKGAKLGKQMNYNPLHHAAWHKKTDIVEYFIKQGVNINHQDDYGRTPLNMAFFARDPQTIKLLLDNGADVNIVDKCEETPLWEGANTTASPESLKLLLDKGVNINKPNKWGQTPLFTSLYRARTIGNNVITPFDPEKIKPGRLDNLKFFLEQGADPFIPNHKGDSPMSIILKEDNLFFFKFLLKHHKDFKNINYQDKNGMSLLMHATLAKAVNISWYLCEQKIDKSLQDKDGNTSLHLAALHNTPSTFTTSSCITNLNLPNNNGDSPLIIAARKGFKEITQHLCSLLSTKINLKNKEGNSALHEACTNGHLEIAKTLLNHHKLTDPNVQNNLGQTPLLLATINNKPNVVKLLLEKGANINIHDRNNQTPLTFGKEKNFTQIQDMLLNKNV